MRGPHLAMFVLLALSGCGESDPRWIRPPPLVVDRIERELAGRPCIGPLDRWERHYFHPGSAGPHVPPAWGVNLGVIAFDLKQAGIHGLRARRVLDSYMDQGLDHRPMRVAFGEYDIATGTLTVQFCGGNHDPVPPEMLESMKGEP